MKLSPLTLLGYSNTQITISLSVCALILPNLSIGLSTSLGLHLMYFVTWYQTISLCLSLIQRVILLGSISRFSQIVPYT